VTECLAFLSITGRLATALPPKGGSAPRAPSGSGRGSRGKSKAAPKVSTLPPTAEAFELLSKLLPKRPPAAAQ